LGALSRRGSSAVTVSAVNVDFVSNAAKVTLEARLPDGRVLTAVGESRKESVAGNLGWVFPVVILTSLTSLIWVGPTYRAIANGRDEHIFTIAVDRACADLAAQIAASSAQG